MLGTARQVFAAKDYTVRGAAPSGVAADGLEAASGIASRTIASWEHAWARGRKTLKPRDVLVGDEAGMVGSRQMVRVLDAVRAAGAKLVLVGDQEQLKAIEAGAAFRAIAERVGAVEITEVRRQLAGWQREDTRKLATGRTADALDRYQAAGMLHAHANDAPAREALLDSWQAARTRAPGEKHIILAHTRDDVRALNEGARAKRRSAWELGPDVTVSTELGLLPVAVGERLYFLRNERGLGGTGGPGVPGATGSTAVKNGALGTLLAIDGEGEAARLTVRQDRATSAAAVVSFALADYAHLDQATRRRCTRHRA